MTERTYDVDDPRHHAAALRGLLAGVVEHARDSVGAVEDPRAQALFETAAEVCLGLQTALQHFEDRSEEAWRP